MAEIAMTLFSAGGQIAGVGGSTVGTVLQGVATAGSVIMGLMQSQQTLAAGKAAQHDANFNAKLERLNSEADAAQSDARALEIRRDAIRKIAAARVAFAGSGLDISSGQLTAIEGSIERDRDYGVDLENSNRDIRLAEGELRARTYELQGANAIGAARYKAFGQQIGAVVGGTRNLLSIVRRG